MLQRRNGSAFPAPRLGGAVALIGIVLAACVPDAPGDSDNPLGPRRPVGEFQVHLRWDAPVQDASGQPLEDLAAYRLYYAPDRLSLDSDGNYSLDTGMTPEALVTGLSSGAWQFAVTAIDTAGNESDLSDVVLVEVGEE